MSRIRHFSGTPTNFEWEDTETLIYSEGVSKGATGKIMIGKKDDAKHFVFRYFRIEPGGHSALNDTHLHDHGVMVLHGRARVYLDGNVVGEVGPNDIIYIQPWQPHHLETIGEEPMGFLCIIPNKDMLQELNEK